MQLEKPTTRNDYIFAQKRDRELATIIRLVCDPSGQARHQFGAELNWSMPYVWLGLRIPQKRLIGNDKKLSGKFDGDVDVCGGSLSPNSQEEYDRCFRVTAEMLKRDIDNLPSNIPKRLRKEAHPLAVHNLASMMLLEEKGIKWPPDLTHISALEVKSGWYSAENEVKGMGRNKKARDQALALCEMGFNRVAVAKFLVTEPVLSPGHHPWMIAGARSGIASEEYWNDQTRGRLVDGKDPFGTIVLGIGAVPGRLEHMAGAATWKWCQAVPPNPYLAQASARRKSIEHTLREVMISHPIPSRVPVLVLACSDDKCAHIYCTEISPIERCPVCGRPPRSAPQTSE